MIEPTGYWTFYANPKRWEVDKKLSLQIIDDYYTISNFHKEYIHKGHLGLIRVGNDYRTKKQLNGREKLERGIYAVVEILSEPKFIYPPDDEYYLDEDLSKKRFRVKIRYIKNLLNNPILIDDNSLNNIVYDKYLIKGHQASTMPLKRETFLDIIHLLEGLSNLDFSMNYLSKYELNNLSEINKLESRNINATPEVKEIFSKRIERGRIAQVIKSINNYECQICKEQEEDPHVFKKENDVYYIETHHIMPVSKQKKGSLSINNLITVCPNHHKQIHHGNVEIEKNNKDKIIFIIDDENLIINKTKIK